LCPNGDTCQPQKQGEEREADNFLEVPLQVA
jgi:hypothetical protein